MKMTGRGMSLPLDSFEIIRKIRALFWENHRKGPGFFRTMEFENYIFSVCMEVIFLCRPRALQSFYDLSVFFAVIRHGLELIFSQKILKNYMQKT